MSDRGLVRKTDAAELGRRLINVERRIPNQRGPTSTSFKRTLIPAKVTEVGQDGRYSCIEQIINEAGNGWVDLSGGRIWDGQAGNLPQVYEMNGSEDITVDSIVLIFYSSSNTSNDNKWYFDGDVPGSGASGSKVRWSVQKLQNFIQFTQDFPINDDAIALGPQPILGSQEQGPRCYAGMEEDGYNTLKRIYMWLCNLPFLDISLIQPEDDGDAAHTNSQKRHIRIYNSTTNLGKQIQHWPLSSDLMGTPGFVFPLMPNGEIYACDVAALNNKVATVPAQQPTWLQIAEVFVKMGFDMIGHAYSYDETNNDYEGQPPYDPNNPDKNKPQLAFSIEQSDYPTSGSLFNVQIGQLTRILDSNGNDTAAYNGANALTYWLQDNLSNAVRSNKENYSTKIQFSQDAVAVVGPPAGNGNEDNIYSTLAKVFNYPITYFVKLIAENVTASTTLQTADVYIEGVDINGGSDIEDGVAFDVNVELLDANGGARQALFDGVGEHELKLTLKYASDGAIIETKQAFITADTPSAGKSGVSISFTVNIPESRKTDNEQICVDAVLSWTTNANALPAQLGDTNVSRDDILCGDIDGAVAVTSSLDLAAELYSLDGDQVEIDGVDMVSFADAQYQNITGDYTIQVGGGNTTNYTNQAAVITVTDLANNPVNFELNDDGNVSTSFNITLTNPVNGTDGYAINITAIEESFVIAGQELRVKITTASVPDAEDTFEFTSEVFYWDDDFED